MVAIASAMVAGFYQIFSTGYRSIAKTQTRSLGLNLARSHLERRPHHELTIKLSVYLRAAWSRR